MKFFVPIQLKATGGTSSFARKLQVGMQQRGHTVTFYSDGDYDVLLVIVACPWRYLFQARRLHRPIVHRLDGVYYAATVAGALYPLYNARMQIIHRWWADTTIYQSIYSQRCVELFFGKADSQSQQIIYNGVDVQHFTPAGESRRLREAVDQPVFMTWSRFRRHDQIVPLIKALTIYQQKYHPQAKLCLIGNFDGQVATLPQRYRHHPHLHFMGAITHQELPSYARGADVFVMTHQNPPCPNNVIEAMACGLPICGVADGAMPELVQSGHQGELLPTNGEAFDTPRQLDPTQLAATMYSVWRQRKAYGHAARVQAEERFTLDRMIDSYLQAL